MTILQKRRDSKTNNRYQPPPSSDSSLSRSTPPPPIFRRVLTTNPDRTAALWELVRAAKSAKMSLKRKNNNRDDYTEGSHPNKALRRSGSVKAKQKSTLHEADAEELNEILTAPDDIPDDQSDAKKSRMSARSVKFEAEVLTPRRIKITTTTGRYRDPFKHFSTDPPSRGDYTTLERLEASQLWLSPGENSSAEIVEEYQIMANRQMCEAEYASFAMEMFFKRHRRFPQIPSDRKWRAERTILLFCPPEGDNWVAPPLFETDTQEFKFDIRPDCCYWVSLSGFNDDYRGDLYGVVYMYKDAITCPYFTVEFKKHGQSASQARAQAAGAAAVALYNRFLLKQKALETIQALWAESDKNQMRHYVITFVGSQFAIWILRADFGDDDDSWNGCSMSRLYESKCTSASIVRQLKKWINEIHRWGLSEHATGCERDVKIILQDDDVEVSRL